MSERRRRRGAPGDPLAPPPSGGPGSGSGRVLQLGLAAALCGAIVVGYLPALGGGFVWDDVALVVDNPLVRASDGLFRFWFTTEAYDYWPLTSSTFWLEWRLWGPRAAGYHATNLVLHAVGSLLLWAVLRRLRFRGAYLAALVFAIHPVNVASVAWISQRKNLVAMLFFVLAVLWFLRDEDRRAGEAGPSRRGTPWYALSLGAFVLAVLGKGSAAVLPAVLLLLVWWRNGRLRGPDLARVLPFALAGAALAAVNVWFQTHGEGPIRAASPLDRVLGASAAVWFYLSKALLPLDLAFFYPQWSVDPGSLRWWLPLAAAVLVSAALVRARHSPIGRPLALAWAYFCVTLVPVMGLVDVAYMRYSLVADHYQHLAVIGVVALGAAAWAGWAREARGWVRAAAAGVAVAAVGALLVLTVRQSATFRDEETLYRATLATSPESWLAHYNLAVVLEAQGRRDEAVVHLEEAVRLKPDHAKAHTNLAIALLDAGRPEEAREHAERAVRSAPDLPEALVNLGVVLSRTGRPAEAVAPLERAVALRPASPEALHNLGLALASLGDALTGAGRDVEAASAFEKALGLRPEDASLHARLAFALVRSGRLDEATAHYEESLRLEPSGPAAAEWHYNLGVLVTAAGRAGEGRGHYTRALELRPDYAEAHYNLAVALLGDGRLADATVHLEAAARSRPDLVAARLALADAYARTGRLAEAIAEAEVARDVAPPAERPAIERAIRAWRARAR